MAMNRQRSNLDTSCNLPTLSWLKRGPVVTKCITGLFIARSGESAYPRSEVSPPSRRGSLKVVGHPGPRVRGPSQVIHTYKHTSGILLSRKNRLF